ncbi:AEC family transporter [Aliiroseovarius sp. 2305UL8-7]|uniref:AEC family transporter n=1 Tax=Aliiroseovarius conchicola TaxID=3121637 RepID=UPI003528C147
MELALSILPILLTLAVGYLLVLTRILPSADWPAIETLSFRLLIPVILLRLIAQVDLSSGAIGPFVITLCTVCALAALVAFGLRLIPQSKLSDPSFTTLFQTTTRVNGFVALAGAELFLGTQGAALIAVAMAVLIAPINVVNILLLTAFGPQKASVRGIAVSLVKNPLIQATILALAINLLGIHIPKPIDDTLELIGRAALGVGILAIGAGISLRRLLVPRWQVLLGVILRPGLTLGLLVVIAPVFGLTPQQTLAACFVFGVACATNGYVVARQMGGDAELYADIMTWQTVISLIVLPAMAIWLLP